MSNTACHPGSILRYDVIPALKLSEDVAARQLGISAAHLRDVLNEKAPITADLALRIERWLGVMNGGRARMWLEMQMDYDLQVAQASPPTGVLKAPV